MVAGAGAAVVTAAARAGAAAAVVAAAATVTETGILAGTLTGGAIVVILVPFGASIIGIAEDAFVFPEVIFDAIVGGIVVVSIMLAMVPGAAGVVAV